MSEYETPICKHFELWRASIPGHEESTRADEHINDASSWSSYEDDQDDVSFDEPSEEETGMDTAGLHNNLANADMETMDLANLETIDMPNDGLDYDSELYEMESNVDDEEGYCDASGNLIDAHLDAHGGYGGPQLSFRSVSEDCGCSICDLLTQVALCGDKSGMYRSDPQALIGFSVTPSTTEFAVYWKYAAGSENEVYDDYMKQHINIYVRQRECVEQLPTVNYPDINQPIQTAFYRPCPA